MKKSLMDEFQSGCDAMLMKDYQTALQHFRVIYEANPHHPETLTNMGTCYLQMGLLNEAVAFYIKMQAVDPKDTQVLFNLGVIYAKQNRLKEAIECYSRAIEVYPDFYEAHHNLGAIYLGMKNKAAALSHYQAALRLQPTNEAIQHTINVLMGNNNLSSSPPAYIRSLFDSYADHYDSHLRNDLHYQMPYLFFQAIEKIRGKSEAKWNVLDLGCGTGLCGEYIKPLTKKLVGVDLSDKMLAVAADKKIYDELVSADIIDYLKTKHNEFDLILAGDVLVYIGELSSVLSLVHQALKPEALFLFDLEISQKENYYLTESGRFAHAKAYVDQLLMTNGLKIVDYHQICLRQQEHQDVLGHFYLTQKN